MRSLPVVQGGPRRPASPRVRTTIVVASLLVSSLVLGPAGSALAGALPTGALAGAAPAVFVPPTSTQFDVDGFLQAATVTTPGDVHSGGLLTVNNQVITVPQGTIVILPANALSWQEMFAQAPVPYAPSQTGLATTDIPTPPYTYEVHVVGNRVGDQYIAGLIDIAQQGLNSGAGYINFIDYSTGEFRVGGTITADGSLSATNPGARVRLNDPLARYGRVDPSGLSDPRFTVDADNPTITAGTGFPMCIPRVAPTGVNDDVSDPLCPQDNRPGAGTGPNGEYALAIQTNDPVALPGIYPDATKQAPMEIGDFVSFAGTLTNDAAGSYVSAHTVSNNTAIYTWPGSNPAYVFTDVTLIGTGGLTVIGAGEAAIRTRFEGMTTDPSRNIHLYGIDLDPATGATTDRDWGTIGVDPGPPNGAVKGRWRFRPPCLPFGTVPTKPDRQCVMNAAGTFLPPTREMRAVVEGQQTQNPANAGAIPYANGIFAGQYHAPILEYIFPENIPGTPIVPNNFEAIAFLACGGYTSAGGTLAAQLNPWPGAVAPNCANAVTAPVANAGGPYTVASGGTITLNGSATGTNPITFAWTADQGTFADNTLASAVYTAPVVAATTTVNLSLAATNGVGSNTATTTITINAPAAPTVAHVAPQSVFSSGAGSFQVSATDPNQPPDIPLTFTVTQAGAPALPVLNVGPVTCATPPTCTATVSYSAPTLPTDQVTASTINLTITATNTGGVSSTPEFTTVTINPLPDAVSLTNATYRLGKQRLDLSATSSVISPNVVLTLNPYITTLGDTFTPTGTFLNGGGGLYTMTLVGVPEPACGHTGTTPPACTVLSLTVSSNHGGTSPAHALDTVRN